MRTGPLRNGANLALAALLPAAAFAVHQLRYMLAFGVGAGAELSRSGHSYLHSVAPWLILLLALTVGAFLRAAGRAFAGQRTIPRYAMSLGVLWMLSATALVAIFVTQELLEGVFATGHPAGLTGIFGYGGWWSIPAAACVGLVVASLFHGALWVVDEVAGRRAPSLAPLRRRRIRPQAPRDLALPRSILGRGASRGRAPPLISVAFTF
jgi:hypothetical protein